MGGTGRKPFVTMDVTPFGLPDERLRPPDSLGPLERRVFLDLVAQCPASQFQKSDLSLLCRWAEWTVVAEQAAGEYRAGGLLTDDGRPSPWLAIHERATKNLIALALRLRLGPQSRADKAPKTLPSAELSYYERMALEDDDDGDEGDPDRGRQ
jgi:phage terminase small subunit